MKRSLATLGLIAIVGPAGFLAGISLNPAAPQLPPNNCPPTQEFVEVGDGDICGSTLIMTYVKVNGVCNGAKRCTHDDVRGQVDMCPEFAESFWLLHGDPVAIFGDGPWQCFCDEDPHYPACDGEDYYGEELNIDNGEEPGGFKSVNLKCGNCPG